MGPTSSHNSKWGQICTTDNLLLIHLGAEKGEHVKFKLFTKPSIKLATINQLIAGKINTSSLVSIWMIVSFSHVSIKNWMTEIFSLVH